MSSLFTHLHVHSHYSLLKALPKLPALVAAAKKEGCAALALTDLGNLYGAIEFYQECVKKEIKPIIGLDAHVGEGQHITLLCETDEGYTNLMGLVTAANFANASLEATHTEQGLTFTRDMFAQFSKGIIAILPALRGELAPALRARDLDRASRIISTYSDIFGSNNLFIEIGLHEDMDGHNDLMTLVRRFAKEHEIPTIAGQEVYYLEREDRRAWMTQRAVENKGHQPDTTDADDADLAFHTQTEMIRLFGSDSTELHNTLILSERCNVTLTLGKFIFPTFPLPPEKTSDQLLRELCMRGLKARGLEGSPEVLERLDYELGIIEFKGYAMYFLVVEDLLRFARENNIYNNIRGSVAGSMTTYLLQITKIDPLAYKIPFERFLNPERPSAPDIDMDFADDRRDEVIAYVRKTYGEDKVAQIGTFGTMLARGVVRDVARALRHPYGVGDRIAKEIPMGQQGFPMTLDRALKENVELKKMFDEEDDVREVITLGKKIEGCARHISVHAAGVVISPKPLVTYSPLQLDPKGGKIITQYDMYSVGEDGVGLTKFDFLGIRNLTILASAVALVDKTRGIKINIDEVPIDDPKTFKMLARGETEGTFQLNGAGMTKWLVELRPSTIHDINAMVALYRPGPMQFIPDYIKRKHNPALVSYLDPALEPILKQTYGTLVYQDDLLMMANQLAGYSWGEVDKFRKAVGKKIPEEMAKQKEKFIEGCISHSSWPRRKAEEVWAWIEPFAAYGFNKAHSASYGLIAYQTSYLKANYPVEYMTAVLSAEAGNIDTVAIMVAECKRMKIPILAPDVNESLGDFTAVRTETSIKNPDAIRFGLYSIKNFGTAVADMIIEERTQNGAFTSLSDFLSRVKGQTLNKRGLESLVQCGALDRIAPEGGRSTMMAHTDLMLEYYRDHVKESAQDSLFNTESSDLRLTPVAPVSTEIMLKWEKELLGLYVSGHPLDRLKEALGARMNIHDLKTKAPKGVMVVAAGMIEESRVILTRGGDQMAFIKIADYEGSLEAVVFPKMYAQYRSILLPEALVAMKGKLTTRNGELSMVVEKLKAL